jgi:hypothetical protein
MPKPLVTLALVLLACTAHAGNDLRTARNLARALAKRDGRGSDSLTKTSKSGVITTATWASSSRVQVETKRKNGSSTTRFFLFERAGGRFQGPIEAQTITRLNDKKVLFQRHGEPPVFLPIGAPREETKTP